MTDISDKELKKHIQTVMIGGHENFLFLSGTKEKIRYLIDQINPGASLLLKIMKSHADQTLMDKKEYADLMAFIAAYSSIIAELKKDPNKYAQYIEQLNNNYENIKDLYVKLLL